MFGAIALGALSSPLGLVHFSVCATRVIRWGSKKDQKHIKMNGLSCFRGSHFGRPIWAKSVPMQRGARFQFFRSVPTQRGAHFLGERESLGEPGVPNPFSDSLYISEVRRGAPDALHRAHNMQGFSMFL